MEDPAADVLIVKLQTYYPNAKIFSSTLDAFGAVVDAKQRALLPVMTAEIGDTWAYGSGSDPLKFQLSREIGRRYAACIERKQCDVTETAILRFERLIIKIPEHTWGTDWQCYNGDNVNWTNAEVYTCLNDRKSGATGTVLGFDHGFGCVRVSIMWSWLTRCSVLKINLHSRKLLDPTPLLRLKRCRACDQWHSSRESTALTGGHCTFRPNAEGKSNLINYETTLNSWREQRSYIPNAIAMLRGDGASTNAKAFADELDAALKPLRDPAVPNPSTKSGWTQVPSGLAQEPFVCVKSKVTLAFATSGAIASFTSADGTVTWNGALGEFAYQTVDENDYGNFGGLYTGNNETCGSVPFDPSVGAGTCATRVKLCDKSSFCTVLVFRQKFTLEDAIEFHAFAPLEARPCV
jgi:hypothetical protein